MSRAQFGETNPNAKLTDAQVDLMRALREGERTPGVKRFWTLDMLATKFEIDRRSVARILANHQRP